MTDGSPLERLAVLDAEIRELRAEEQLRDQELRRLERERAVAQAELREAGRLNGGR